MGGGRGTPAPAGPLHGDARHRLAPGWCRGGLVSAGGRGASHRSPGSRDSNRRNADTRPSPSFQPETDAQARAGHRNETGHGGHQLCGSARPPGLFQPGQEPSCPHRPPPQGRRKSLPPWPPRPHSSVPRASSGQTSGTGWGGLGGPTGGMNERGSEGKILCDLLEA